MATETPEPGSALPTDLSRDEDPHGRVVNEDLVRKTIVGRMKLSRPVAADSAYRSFVSRANRQLYPSLAARANMQNVIGLTDPGVLSIQLEELADDRFVSKLYANGTVARIYGSYGIK